MSFVFEEKTKLKNYNDVWIVPHHLYRSKLFEAVMKILGVSAFYHDSAACLLEDGVLTAAVQEERFTRIRHDERFPSQSIQWCLKSRGLRLDEIDSIAFYEKPFIKFDRILETTLVDAPATFAFAIAALPIWLKQKLWIKKLIWRELDRKIPIIFTSHHEAHAASAFFPSPFEKAATLTVDGVGEWSTTTWGIGAGSHLSLKKEIRYPHSLGLLYSAFTQYLGFRVNSAEYKVMGLAPFGEPKYTSLILDNLIQSFDDGSFLLNMDYFSYSKRLEMINDKFEMLFGRIRRKPESPIDPFHADVARSLQYVTEEVMLKLSRHVHKETQLENLCLAGGVALNCVANGRIRREGPFRKIWVQPGAGDSGGAIGAAYLAWHHVYQQPRNCVSDDAQLGSFLGPEFLDCEIEKELKEARLVYSHFSQKQLLKETVKQLVNQKVIGWFQGKLEFGPRALGARSIIADPRNTEMQDKINLKIKFRESFRPFAPSVLEEEVANYFETNEPSPYMLFTEPVKIKMTQPSTASSSSALSNSWLSQRLKSISSQLPAITHVDGSARLHTVNRTTSPLFYDLLKEFQSSTQCPVLVNTSFNVRGEPIVCSPKDAISCFLRTNLDSLVIGSFMVRREEQDSLILEKARLKQKLFELD